MRDLSYQEAVLEQEAEMVSEQWLKIRMIDKLGRHGAHIISELYMNVTRESYNARLADRQRAVRRAQELAGLL
jgi:hypothetical protein